MMISINDQSINSLPEFWDTLKSLKTSNSNENNNHDQNHNEQGIQSLAIKNAGFHGQQSCRNLVKLLLVNGKVISNLHTLIIQESKLGPRGIKILVEELLLKQQQSSSVLKTLDFATCRMGHFGSESLSKYMPYASQTLLILNLSSNNLGDDGIWKLAASQGCSGLSCLNVLEELDLSSNSISDNGLSEIGRNVIPCLHELHTLNLSNNHIKGLSIDSFISALGLETCSISSLDLSSNQIQPPISRFDTDTDDDESVGDSDSINGDDDNNNNDDGSNVATIRTNLPIARILETTTTTDQGPPSSLLEMIDLSHNLLGDDGAVDIAESLGKSKIIGLKQLLLKDNHIGDKGADAIVDAFDEVVVGSNGGAGDCNEQRSSSSSLFLALNLDDNPDISPARINILQVLRKHHQKQQQSSRENSTNKDTAVGDGDKDKDDSKEEVDVVVQSSEQQNDGNDNDKDAAATTIQILQEEVYQLKTQMVKMEQDMNRRIQDMEKKQSHVKNELLQVIDELRIELLQVHKEKASSSSIQQQQR